MLRSFFLKIEGTCSSEMLIPIYVTKCHYVRFEVFTAVTMKKAVFWDVAPCRYCVNPCFGGTYRLHLQGRRQEEICEQVQQEDGGDMFL
jgi:hypothetical protein